MLLEKGIWFENMPEKLSAFHDKYEATGQWYFSLDPRNVNEQWVYEFNPNIREVSLQNPSNMTINIQGPIMRFREN